MNGREIAHRLRTGNDELDRYELADLLEAWMQAQEDAIRGLLFTASGKPVEPTTSTALASIRDFQVRMVP